MVTIEHFSRLVHEIYDAAVDPNHWTAALEEVSSAVGATGCALLTTDPEHNEISVRSSGADPASVTTYNEYFGRLDPSPSALAHVPTGLVVPNEQLVDRDLLTRSEFFNDWADPYEYGDGAYSVLTRGERGTSWLCAAAKARPEPFGTPERVSLLEKIVPHLRHAIMLQARLSELDRHHRDLVAALDSLSDGIAVVGRDGRVIHLNSAAEAIVVTGCACVLVTSEPRSPASTVCSIEWYIRHWQARHRTSQSADAWQSPVPTDGVTTSCGSFHSPSSVRRVSRRRQS